MSHQSLPEVTPGICISFIVVPSGAVIVTFAVESVSFCVSTKSTVCVSSLSKYTVAVAVLSLALITKPTSVIGLVSELGKAIVIVSALARIPS